MPEADREKATGDYIVIRTAGTWGVTGPGVPLEGTERKP
jgi:hypothetical protein